jgi:hypothetical protein
MATNLERYNRALEQVDRAKTEQDKAQGALDALMKGLKSGHGFLTLKEGEGHLRELKAELDEAEEDFNSKLTAFEAEWAKALEEANADNGSETE